MKNTFFFTCLLVSSLSTAQNLDLFARYDSTAIYLDGIRSFVKNNQIRPMGIFFGKIAPEFQTAPQGNFLFQKARKNRISYFSCLLFGNAAMITGLLVTTSELNRPTFGVIRPRNETKLWTGNVLMLTGLAITFSATVPFKRSQKQLNHAVWLRNREVLLGR